MPMKKGKRKFLYLWNEDGRMLVSPTKPAGWIKSLKVPVSLELWRTTAGMWLIDNVMASYETRKRPPTVGDWVEGLSGELRREAEEKVVTKLAEV
jgi:hypothetical protein